MFELVRTGKKITHGVLAVFLVLIFFLIGQLLGGGMDFFIKNQHIIPEPVLKHPNVWLAAFYEFKDDILYFIPVLIPLFLWIKFYEKRSFSSLGFQFSKAIQNYSKGIFYGGLMFCGAFALLYLLGFLEFEIGTPALQGINFIFPSVLVFVGYIFQGGTEEIILRGWLMPVVGSKFKKWIGLVVSALIFSLLHGLNPGITALAVLNLFVFGIFIGLYAINEGSIWGVCGWHTIWNWLQGSFFGLEVSGNSGAPTIFNFKENGPDLITGGFFGPEGGLAVTIVLTIGIVFFVLKKPKNTEPPKIIS